MINSGSGLYIQTSEIGGNRNFATGDQDGLYSLLHDLEVSDRKEKSRVSIPEEITETIERITSFIKILTEEVLKPIQENSKTTLRDLETMLQKAYHPGSIYTLGKYRFATSFNISGTRFERTNDSVVIEGGAIPLGDVEDTTIGATTKTNISSEKLIATDMLGFSSKSASPTGGYENKDGKHNGYGFMGKVPDLRPMSDKEFNKTIYEKIMNTPVDVFFSGYSVEVNNNEIAIMPTFTIKGEHIEMFMKQFSHEKKDNDKLDAPTSKMWLSERS